MLVGEWPEILILDDGKEIPDSSTEFSKLLQEWLDMKPHTKNWILKSINPMYIKKENN